MKTLKQKTGCNDLPVSHGTLFAACAAFRRLKIAVGVCIASILLLQTGFTKPARAYDNDTHYVFTYYLAILAGYHDDEARRVASADISIDIDPNTEPFQLERIINPTDSAQNARVWFHAFYDSRVYWASGGPFGGASAAEKNSADIQNSLEQKCLKDGNIGPYLHFYQDTFSHAGYYSFKGHALDGHAPDFLSSDEAKARSMADGTYAILAAFRKHETGSEPPAYDANRVYHVLHQLVLANPAPRLGKFWTSPDWTKARDIVSRAIGAPVPDWIVFTFNTNGDPTGNDPNWRVFQFSGRYTLRNQNSQLFLDAGDGKSGTRVWQKPESGQAAQRWWISPAGQYYVVKPDINENMALQVRDSSTNNAAAVDLGQLKYTKNQLWTIGFKDSKPYFINANSGQCLDVDGGSKSPAGAIQWPYRGAPNQIWVNMTER